MLRDRLHNLGRIVSLVLLIGVVAVLVVSFIRSKNKRTDIPPVARGEARMGDQVVAITEGYQYVSAINGKPKFKVIAARDTSYVSGRHELEQLELIGYDEAGRESGKIRSDRGDYQQDKELVSFSGNVLATNSDGLEVATDKLNYDTRAELARSESTVNFKRHDLSGTSQGATLAVTQKKLSLLKDAHVVIASKDPKGAPLDMRGEKAEYEQTAGIVRFIGNATISQGEQSGRADTVTGIYRPNSNRLDRIEARGNSYLKTDEKGKHQEIAARDIDFFFNDDQRLIRASAAGQAVARSLEKDAPRELSTEKLEAAFTPQARGSEITSIVTGSRTIMKITPADKTLSERIIEADAANVTYHAGGKFLARAEATGNALLTVTPLTAGPKSEIRKLKAPKFTAEFFEVGNDIRTFVAETGAVAEFIPMETGTKKSKRVLSGSRMTADFAAVSQDVTDLTVDGNARLDEGERHATAQKAVHNTATQTTLLRGKPQVWDSAARTDAAEIDVNHETGESLARGRVRTTYYSQETTKGAAPFRKSKSPVFVSSERATFRHRESAARYEVNARAWQDDNFVRGDTLELDNGERTMIATGNAQSAIYDFERKGEDGQKEVVPVFGAANQIHFFDARRLIKYDGQVRIRQGTDQIDSANAEVTLDDDYRMTHFLARGEVVLTQPSRVGKGDQLEYTSATDEAVLTGNLATIVDNEHDATSKGARLTLHLRDAKITANDEGGVKRVRTTHRIKKRS